ncbi:MAG TPA: GNAT family N-acetyltransferase [Anaerolineae bacterium]|nr:GNAT family N-acetyltransferase [Anaerolineae bacterium]
MSDLTIRPALMGDLQVCLEFDASYTTDYVWQMDSRLANGAISVAFHHVRLPRSMRVAYPRDAEALLADWRLRDVILVAERQRTRHGFISLSALPAQRVAQIGDMVVSRPERRQGVGSALIGAALRWARERSLKQVVIEVQTKNHPAISLLNKLGFSFCGFNDRHYFNQDIALFFSRAVR